jgi:hypothetical protein
VGVGGESSEAAGEIRGEECAISHTVICGEQFPITRVLQILFPTRRHAVPIIFLVFVFVYTAVPRARSERATSIR